MLTSVNLHFVASSLVARRSSQLKEKKNILFQSLREARSAYRAAITKVKGKDYATAVKELERAGANCAKAQALAESIKDDELKSQATDIMEEVREAEFTGGRTTPISRWQRFNAVKHPRSRWTGPRAEEGAERPPRRRDVGGRYSAGYCHPPCQEQEGQLRPRGDEAQDPQRGGATGGGLEAEERGRAGLRRQEGDASGREAGEGHAAR